jgi:hypothetical protein
MIQQACSSVAQHGPICTTPTAGSTPDLKRRYRWVLFLFRIAENSTGQKHLFESDDVSAGGHRSCPKAVPAPQKAS